MSKIASKVSFSYENCNSRTQLLSLGPSIKVAEVSISFPPLIRVIPLITISAIVDVRERKCRDADLVTVDYATADNKNKVTDNTTLCFYKIMYKYSKAKLIST